MDVPERIRGLCSAFLDGLSGVLQHKLYGVYLYGAWAFPEGKAKGDVDLHVILREPLSDEEKSGVGDLHRAIARGFPSLAAAGPDALYILLDDARGTTPPTHQLSEGVVDQSWALHCAHIRAGRCMVLYGPDPRGLYPEPSWAELDVALQGELDYVARHLEDYPAYCILNLCRLVYSYQTGNVVVSKYTSALWALESFPDEGPCIEAAMRVYEGGASEAEKRRVDSEAAGFFGFACEQIRAIRGRSQAA